MSEKMIHLTITPQQARTLASVLVLARQFLAVPPNMPVYPNLGDFKLERDLVTAEIDAARAALLEQLEGQMPTE